MNQGDSKFNPAVLAPPVIHDRKETTCPGEHQHFLYPGQIFVAREVVTISTILGSCAAICLWDWRRKIGGMNHYLLPEGPADSPNRLRYGNVSNPALLNELLALGCEIKDLQARIFGGASAFAKDPLTALGTRNVEIAERFLRDAGIRIVSKDVSGKHGRKLTFNTGDGVADVKNYHSAEE